MARNAASSTAIPSGPLPCAIAERIASSTSRSATTGSVTTGSVGGPSTSGWTEPRPRPRSIFSAAQAATSASVAMTRTTAGHSRTARATAQ